MYRKWPNSKKKNFKFCLDNFTTTCHIWLEREKNLVFEYQRKTGQNGEKMEVFDNIKKLFRAFGWGSGVRDTPERG